MGFIKRTYNLEEYQNVFEKASKMPYDWNRIAGYLLGDRHTDLRFGGSCFDQAEYVVANLPPGCGRLAWDEGYTHFGVLVNKQHYFDPTYCQLGIQPYSSDEQGMNMAYETRIQGGSILVSDMGGYYQVTVDYIRGGFSMQEVDINIRDAKKLVYQSFRERLANPPFIKFPTSDGCEVKVSYRQDGEGLEVHTKYDENICGISGDRRLSEMEKTYGFTAEELLQYFAWSWDRVRRQLNVD